MSEVLQQENAIILAVAEKLVSLGSEISQDLIEGKESKVKEKKWIKIFTLLTAYRKRATYSDDQLESILYDLRLLSEESVFPTVSPLVGQPIDYNINNGDNEVIGYASLASFPATGEDDTIYIDRSTDTLYRWDTVTEAYISVGGGGTTYFLGVYASLVALQTAHPTASPGEYAYVDTGIGDDIVTYIWDDDDAQWILSAGAPSDWTVATVHAATDKSTPADADELGILDSAASFVLKKLTWTNLKATLKTYFDTLYAFTFSNALSLTGLSLKWGGTLANDTAIDGLFAVEFGRTTPVSRFNIYVEPTTGDVESSFEHDPAYLKMEWIGVDSDNYVRVENELVSLGSASSAGTTDVYIRPTRVDVVGGPLNLDYSVDLASASTVDLSTVTGNTVNITGTTTITAFGTVAEGAKRTLIFAGALILTHNATSLILPTQANITTEAGDVAEFVSLGSGNWKCVSYQRASGAPLSGATTGSVSIDPVSFDGMGAVILAGTKRYIRAKFAGTITGWSIIADGSSPTCELDIKKIATGTALPSSSIVASDPPDLTTGNAVDSTSLTGWTTSIAAGDILEISVTAATVMTKMEFALRVS